MEQTLGRSPARLGRPASCQDSSAWGEPSRPVELPLQNLVIWSVSMEPHYRGPPDLSLARTEVLSAAAWV